MKPLKVFRNQNNLRFNYLILLILVLSQGCACIDYFSNTDEIRMEGSFFDLEAKVYTDPAKNNSEELQVWLIYNKNMKTIKNSVKIYPINIKSGDTLKYLSKYASQYIFHIESDMKLKDLDIFVYYHTDSLDKRSEKYTSFVKLERSRKCRFHPVLH